MSAAAFPTDPTDPRFVAAVVGVLATAAVYVYAALGASGLTVAEVSVVLLATLGPATVAYELAGRLGGA
jgi:uncharacterized protein (DUF2336 family)